MQRQGGESSGANDEVVWLLTCNWKLYPTSHQLRCLQSRQLRCIHRHDSAQHTSRDHVADEMIIHRHKTHEHRRRKKNDDDLQASAARHCDQPYASKGQDSGSVAGWKTADVVAALKWMEAVRAGANERRIIVNPRVGPIASEDIA